MEAGAKGLHCEAKQKELKRQELTANWMVRTSKLLTHLVIKSLHIFPSPKSKPLTLPAHHQTADRE